MITVFKSCLFKTVLDQVCSAPFAIQCCVSTQWLFCRGCRGYSNLSGAWIEDDIDLCLSSVTTCSTYSHSRRGGSATVTSLLNSVWKIILTSLYLADLCCTNCSVRISTYMHAWAYSLPLLLFSLCLFLFSAFPTTVFFFFLFKFIQLVHTHTYMI